MCGKTAFENPPIKHTKQSTEGFEKSGNRSGWGWVEDIRVPGHLLVRVPKLIEEEGGGKR